MEKRKKSKVFFDIISILIILGLMFFIYKIFNKYNFNEFVKSEYIQKSSEFSRDSQEKYSKINSYKITSNEFNDAMFYKTINVEKNKPYKVTCMVKTQDVKTQNDVSNGGAQICITDTTEVSRSVVGTNDWQKIEFMFDSKNREQIDIGFRLGGYDDQCTGTAWFSDFTIESGIETVDTEWNFALFIFENIDVQIQENGISKNVKLSMSKDDINVMNDNIKRFENSIRTLSNYNMSATTKVYTIEEPIKTISYDETNGYYIAPKDISGIIDSYVKEGNFDHIFIAVRFGDIMNNTEIPVNDWIGLRLYGLLWNRVF